VQLHQSTLGPPGPGQTDAAVALSLQQSQGPVVVIKGEMLTLNCTVSKSGPVGPVNWLKNQSNVNQTIYDQKGSSQRVMRAVNGSETDFTIHIRDVRLEDAGTYYCVKFRRNTSGDEVFKSGGGTKVLVHARPSKLAVSGPSHRMVPGQSVTFTCSARGFFPRDIQVQWLKNSVPVQAELPRITSEPSNSSYNMSSTVQVTLHKNDVRSELTCQVQHSTLSAPLRRTYALGQALRGEAHSPGAGAGLSRGLRDAGSRRCFSSSSPQRVCGRCDWKQLHKRGSLWGGFAFGDVAVRCGMDPALLHGQCDAQAVSAHFGTGGKGTHCALSKTKPFGVSPRSLIPTT
uniref:Ig-like domain-containing protein n=1 Tax=Phasianus colchicus TaxID=9054 RepID=A0A669PFM8_PHACC